MMRGETSRRGAEKQSRVEWVGAWWSGDVVLGITGSSTRQGKTSRRGAEKQNRAERSWDFALGITSKSSAHPSCRRTPACWCGDCIAGRWLHTSRRSDTVTLPSDGAAAAELHKLCDTQAGGPTRTSMAGEGCGDGGSSIV